MSIKFQGDKSTFIKRLNTAFKQSVEGQEIGNQFRYIITWNDSKKYNVNFFETTGTVQIQPINDDVYNLVSSALSENLNVSLVKGGEKEIFIVHGHDNTSKESLENILYKWELKPFAIQNEDSKGQTIIEFLENEIKSRSVSIVLLTGDDIGYSIKEGQEKKQPRARQNVILELGMLIGAMGRKNCIIIRQSNVEIPSDIDGLIYLAFDKEIKEIKDKLREKLNGCGLNIK